MKRLIGELIWLLIFASVVCVSLYPGVTGLRPMAGLFVWAMMLFAGFAALALLAGSYAARQKNAEKAIRESILKSADIFEKVGPVQRAINWTQFVLMLGALGFAGFTVTGFFYAAMTLVSYVSIGLVKSAGKELRATAD